MRLEYFPAVQLVQDEAWNPLWYDPGLQAKQVLDPLKLAYVPAAHSWQSDAPAVPLNLPASQSTHPVVPLVLVYFMEKKNYSIKCLPIKAVET